MREIEYFFSTHSAFAYFGARRFYEIAEAAGRRVAHKPFDFWPVVRAAKGTGWSGFSEAHRAYFFGVEIERWSAFRNAPIASLRPSRHDAPLALSSGLLLAADRAGADVGALAFALMEAHWRDDADLSDAVTLAKATERLGLDAAPLLAAAETPEIQAAFAATTQEAIDRSIFGSPTYVVDGEAFYGQDRLELLEQRMIQGA